MTVTDTPALLMVDALMAGFGCNGGVIGFRTSNGTDAIQLSGMSQSIGYMIAAFAPMVWPNQQCTAKLEL